MDFPWNQLTPHWFGRETMSHLITMSLVLSTSPPHVLNMEESMRARHHQSFHPWKIWEQSPSLETLSWDRWVTWQPLPVLTSPSSVQSEAPQLSPSSGRGVSIAFVLFLQNNGPFELCASWFFPSSCLFRCPLRVFSSKESSTLTTNGFWSWTSLSPIVALLLYP